MKNHLVNLLFEEFKQQAFFDDLEKKGLTISDAIVVNNWDIVADIVGFPSDNTLEYDFEFINDGQRNENKKLPDDEMFCRDFLYDNFFDAIESIAKNQEIFVTDKGLAIKEYFQEEKIKEKLASHIDWLYETFEKYKNGELE